MRAIESSGLRGVLACAVLCLVGGCGGAASGDGMHTYGGSADGGSIPIGVPIPFFTPESGVVAFGSVGATGFSPGAWGGRGTRSMIVRYHGTGDYTVGFWGTFPGLTSASDVSVFVTAAHDEFFDVASASVDSADAEMIWVHVMTYAAHAYPHLPRDSAFSVMVTRGAFAGVAGFANVEGEGVLADVLSFGGDETTGVFAARTSEGRYTVRFEGSYPGVTRTDDVTVLVAINGAFWYETAAASLDGGSADGGHVTLQVSAWSTSSFPPRLTDASFSVLLLRRATTSREIRAFASVNGDAPTPTVQNFGGGETTDVVVTHPVDGYYSVTFHGSYPDVVDASDVTVLAAITDDDDFDTATIGNVIAGPTAIIVTVWVWSTASSPSTLENRDFSIVIPH